MNVTGHFHVQPNCGTNRAHPEHTQGLDSAFDLLTPYIDPGLSRNGPHHPRRRGKTKPLFVCKGAALKYCYQVLSW